MVKNYYSKIHIRRNILLFWILLILPIWSFAQSGTHVTWDNQVGCTEFNSDIKEDREEPYLWEDVENGQCVKVCEKSTVKYTVNGSNITNAVWNVVGGQLFDIPGISYLSKNITWGNVGSGSISVTIIYSNGTQETKTICINKIPAPIAKIKVIGQTAEEIKYDEITICQNTTINFENLSSAGNGSNIVHYMWTFTDDNSTSSLFEPSHTFTQPGEYYVILAATNECNCKGTTKLKVRVLDSTPVIITCPSVVCEGQTATYTANEACPDKGEWEVIGGTIINQNGNQIDVEWNGNLVDGFGYVRYLSKCGCPVWTTVKVPVVQKKGEIKGAKNICVGKQMKYSLPQWPTTNVQWAISSGYAELNLTSHRNEVYLTATQPGTITLVATYENTLLGCGGVAEFKLEAGEPISISGSGLNEVCVGDMQTFTASPNISVSWAVTVNNSTSNYTGSSLNNFIFSQVGTYSIVATGPSGCPSEPIIVKVTAAPSAPSGTISGENIVCTGVPYTYTLSSVDNGVIPVWEAINGTIQGSNAGSSVTVIFTPGFTNYGVTVKNKTLQSPGCFSTPVTFNAGLLNLNNITITSATPGPYCPSSQQVFTADLGGIIPDL